MGNKNLGQLLIIIPCYNEYSRLPISEIQNFLTKETKATLFFIDDASTDNTIGRIEALEKQFPAKVLKLSNSKNLGKAESIRKVVRYCLAHNIGENFAYLDADLATSLEECYSYLQFLEDGKTFVFASRILKIGSIVERKFSRFLSGRVIASFISNILDIKVYDTQCGCKLFTANIAKLTFDKPFISKWLFDVEIFSRMLTHYGKPKALALMAEIPVKKWIDKGDSKVKLSYFFRLWVDLYRIWSSHRKNLSLNE
ncbi:MAG: dolichyl-phosphate beta-glucosyltransferase [Maribacter sp.]|jgi:dolichyl-phosphate beta-glucosyltransferase|tara:strand:+ start:159 stop:923 length:765 start_codon:yes stop_codon:yes gene_type:complete